MTRRTLLTLTIHDDIEGFPTGSIQLVHQQLRKFTASRVRSYALLDEEGQTIGGFLAPSDQEAVLQGLATVCELLVPEQMSKIVDANGVHS